MSGLQPSKLGTKEYWDNVYEDEVLNFEEIGDEGEIWFGIESVEKMVQWATENVPPSSEPSVLEIGSGNGTLILALLEENYPAKSLAGIDYSPDAIKLSKLVAATKEGEDVTFEPCDFLKDDPPHLSHMDKTKTDVWDLLLDKGTYDAIALGNKDEQGYSPAIHYPSRAARLIRPGGFFLITSCNFTEEELKADFISEEIGLKYHSRIQHPTYTFGGKSGSICCSVAFQKAQ
ncbi:S-adenosyl-L-methionine-dependent methyltransferase [Marasmius fiardii PR-910]|nr:S-adenosyl-L-methionine-dependent methyltransferase [Marasmius fiardii PR-910]